nr:immunoglobulin heavy chain junction region [Macaca mulatta]MOW86931.1 immunoglobulin heavy chain junction region [Macaca mulatta]MOW86946.1 immunoglobulin heavy chain junction region [Macaca mulatta]MOW87082.1 immunoglobulin heavy chain junction region [Macaca mulatta]MOW87117.1 immunoglobulin heavy chain junction region [Macaca mulatta]
CARGLGGSVYWGEKELIYALDSW